MEELIELATALLAKEKGFNESTIDYWQERNGNWEEEYPPSYDFGYGDYNKSKTQLSRPTQSSLQKWLREERKLFICVKHRITGSQEEPIIEFTYNGTNGERNNIYYDTYEKALENALFECLQMISETVA